MRFLVELLCLLFPSIIHAGVKMNAIHIIMATSTSANPHHVPNERIENIVRKRKMSAITFLIFGVLLIIAGSLLASFESQRFSVSFIVFGVIGIMFAFIYWISAEKLLIALRKFNVDRMRQIQFQTSNSGVYDLEYLNSRDAHSTPNGLPSYEQSVSPRMEIPPSYDEAIKIKSSDPPNDRQQSAPIHSISLTIDQSTSAISNRK